MSIKRVMVLAATLSLAVAASAGVIDARQVVKARKEHLKALGRSMKSLRDEADSWHPNWVSIEKSAAAVAKGATDLPTWFPAGSGSGAGVKTKALAAIWLKPAEFQTASRAFATQADKLVDVAKTHDAGSVRRQAKAVGRTCGGCHRHFRAHRD